MVAAPTREAVAVDKNGFVKRQQIYIQVGDASGDREDWKFETFAVILSDGDKITSEHGDTDEEIEKHEVKMEWEKLEVAFQFDTSGILKLKDDFFGITIFKTLSKVDPGPQVLEFKDGAIATYNLIGPKSVLWSSRVWDADAQSFRKKSPVGEGFTGPFEYVVTKGNRMAITGMKNGQRQIAWHEDPDYEDWTGRFED